MFNLIISCLWSAALLLGEEAIFEFTIHAFSLILCTFVCLPMLSVGGDRRSPGKLSYQELGVAKLSGFCEWLSIHPLVAQSDDAKDLDLHYSSHKMIIFAHHRKVLDGVQVRLFLSWCFSFNC
jgi:hypothetical protein